ncbi:MAG: HAD family hydrolase [Prevotellaceae bacterium]|jgi:phosphoglycolate phosphatase|nr:HAD family hydrolase [Prevotellaceae bacterium]
MKKLIIFDLDGTLINSVSDLAASTNYALEKLGLPTHDTDSYRFFVGNGVNKLLERALPENLKNDDFIQKIKAIMLPYYSEHCTDKTAPYQGIVDLLKQIVEKGIKVAVASNKHHPATLEMVKYFFPDINFVAVMGQREGYPTKPDPIIVEDILKIANIDKKDTLYVGDTAVDIQTAKNAEVEIVAVTWGFRPISELEEQNPDRIVDSVEELTKMILNK